MSISGYVMAYKSAADAYGNDQGQNARKSCKNGAAVAEIGLDVSGGSMVSSLMRLTSGAGP